MPSDFQKCFPYSRGRKDGKREGIKHKSGVEQVGDLIAIVSFVIAVVGAVSAIFIGHRDRQSMAFIVAGAFLISFFVNVNQQSRILLQIACVVAFAVSILGAMVAIFSHEESKRTSAIVTGVVSLGTSLLILFSYLDVTQSSP